MDLGFLVGGGGLASGPLWEGHRESRRCSKDTYPESCITKYTSIRRLMNKRGPGSPCRRWWAGPRPSGAGRASSSPLSARWREKEIQTAMAQGRSTKIVSMIKWIRTSRLSIKNSQSLWRWSCIIFSPVCSGDGPCRVACTF